MSMSQDASPQTSPAVSGTPPASASTAVHTRQQAEAQSSSVDASPKATPEGAGDPLFHRSSASDVPNTLDRDDAVDSIRQLSIDPKSYDPKSYVEAIADETMQDVFDDVDRMLNTGAIVAHSSPPDERLAHASARFSVDSFSSGGALAPIDPAQPSDSNLAIPTPETDEPLLGESPASSPERFKAFLVTLSLMVTASVALGIGLALWMAQRGRVELAAQAGANIPPTTTTEFAEGSFERYFQDALAAIDRRYEEEEAQQPESPLLPPPPPPPPGTGNVPLAMDRGYIDVYQQPQVASAPPAANPAPSAQAPAAPAPSSAPTSASAPVQNISPSNTHTLVGILELGDRSAAIFEYAGSAHRIEVGEQIGGSGWSLVSVSGQEAIIRRNGEVRSIYMKQSF